MPRTDAAPSIAAGDLSIARSARGEASVRVVDGVSFTVPRGTTLAVMGPTGSGKSSLAAVLAGRPPSGLSVDGGDALVEGISIRRPGRALRELTYATGFVPQSAGAHLPARLTVAEVISEPLTTRSRHNDARALQVRVATLLDELKLPLGAAVKYPYELSAGMRQRVAIARALFLEPHLFVADDPFMNLDVEVRAAAKSALLRRRRERGMSALIVTNDTDVATDLDADILVLRGGHAVAYGHSTTDLLWTPSVSMEHRLISS